MRREHIDIHQRIFRLVVATLKELKKLPNTQENLIITHQLLRSITSVGANAKEADAASSKKDFVYKMSISKKEANESLYWFQLLHEFESSEGIEELRKECEEVVRILSVIIYNARLRN